MPNIRRIKEQDSDFLSRLKELCDVNVQFNPELTTLVSSIVNDVRLRGDSALIEYTNKFDKRETSVSTLEVSRDEINSKRDEVSVNIINALEFAADRIQRYASRQKSESWSYTDEQGTLLGQKITPVERAGIYVPGGQAAYPSSVLMNCIPAKVAGVDEVIMVVPAPGGVLNPIVLAAASIAGVDRVFTIGGAQAIAALAYGTETIPKVDKIVGPGNRFVTEAKRLVYGTVGIDMIAGPSEVLIIADGSCDPDWIAMDMFAQAEHDVDARSILVSMEETFLDSVYESICRLLPTMERNEIIKESLEKNGAMIFVNDIDSVVKVINQIAPEHLQLAIENPEAILPNIRNAGAIFLGVYTSEALGDYCAGPNHVLPTGQSARFSSPLGVYDFQKRTSIIKCVPDSVSILAEA
ncbi:MAG: histidinol dehydrogenase, partial [Gammaproteobacteria bacterium]